MRSAFANIRLLLFAAVVPAQSPKKMASIGLSGPRASSSAISRLMRKSQYLLSARASQTTDKLVRALATRAGVGPSRKRGARCSGMGNRRSGPLGSVGCRQGRTALQLSELGDVVGPGDHALGTAQREIYSYGLQIKRAMEL
jgi:hypothetical protein